MAELVLCPVGPGTGGPRSEGVELRRATPASRVDVHRLIAGRVVDPLLPRPSGMDDPCRLALHGPSLAGDRYEGGSPEAELATFAGPRELEQATAELLGAELHRILCEERDDLADALRKRGTPLPAARSLYRDLDTDPMAEAFTGWHLRRHGTEPDPEAVDELAQEWMEGTLPDTLHAASPHRVSFQLALINDWIPDDPVTVTAKAMLPEWVRWHGEQAGLPEHLIDRAVAVASGGVRAASDCVGLRV